MSTEEVVKTITMDPLGKVMQVIALGVMAFLANLAWDTSISVAAITARQEAFSQQLVAITRDRYTAAQAGADKALVEQRIGRVEQRTEVVLERLRAVEDKINRMGD